MDEADPARSKAYTRAAEQHKERVEAAASRQSATFHSCTTVFYRSETRARRMRDAEKNSGRWTVQYRLQRVQVMRVCVPSRRRGAWRELSERTDIECAKILEARCGHLSLGPFSKGRLVGRDSRGHEVSRTGHSLPVLPPLETCG